uniref:Protein adenylyltransferase Fic n=1 Tax=Tabanus bromius TaxID=304241 RepID=A0A0K8TS66_TABBR
MKAFNYVLIFIFGGISSIVIFFILKQIHGDRNEFISFMPDSKYLQVRDDFSVYAPYVYDPGEAKHNHNRFRGKNSESSDQEALSSLRVAVEMREMGKHDKALKLFQHALALAPKHPDILVKFGEFLEHNEDDIVKADYMYFQALTINPHNSIALAHRQRTAHRVEAIDEHRLQILDNKRDALSAFHESNSALRRAKKEAYFQHIYHSVGIEGNTMTLAQTRSVLETRMAVEGKTVDEHNEIFGLDAAMKYINATLVNKNDYITVRDILEIHRRVLGHVDPIEGGEFRRTQVYVGGHTPPRPNDVAILMRRFEQWLNSKGALSMHPVRYAALAHYKLVHIHPFTDGNGRTSRLLMNTILMRAGYPPVTIPKQQRNKYYEHLQVANEGDIRPFIRFIADCTEKTLDMYLWATSELISQVPLLPQNDELKNQTIDLVEELDASLNDDTINDGSSDTVSMQIRLDET